MPSYKGRNKNFKSFLSMTNMFLKQFGIFDSTPVVTFVGVAVLVSVSTDARNAGNTKKASNNTVYLLIKK